MREPSIRGFSRFPNGMILAKMFYLLDFASLMELGSRSIKTRLPAANDILDLLNPLPEIERTGRIPKESTK